MAATLPDIAIPLDSYVSINALTGIPAGTEVKVQNKGTTSVILVESIMQPDPSFSGGEIITSIYAEEPSKIVTSGSLEVWAIATSNASGKLSVQTLA